MAAPDIADLVALAVRLVNAGQRERARVVCDRAVAAHAPHPAVLQLLAVLDLHDGRSGPALAHACASLRLRPDHLPTLFLAGDAALAARDLDAASEALERAAALAPREAEAWFRVSLVRQDRRDLPGAIAALERAIELQPGRVDALVNLGIALQESRRLDDALRAYGQAYRLHPPAFGRIAHALATPDTGRLWLDLDELRRALLEAATA